jgi:hypothetical protein
MLAKSGIEIPTWLPPDDVMAEAAAYLKDRKPIVVTLREARYYPERNSNMVAWIEFARTCGNDVIFVRDTAFADTRLDGVEICSRAATDLLFRAALMLQAKANLMVANGPIAIAQFSKVPWLMFRPLTPTLPNYRPGQPEWWHMLGISSGSQLPWASAKQRIVWGDDTLLNIKTAWDKLLNDNSDAPNRSAPPEWSMSTSFILKPSRF